MGFLILLKILTPLKAESVPKPYSQVHLIQHDIEFCIQTSKQHLLVEKWTWFVYVLRVKKHWFKLFLFFHTHGAAMTNTQQTRGFIFFAVNQSLMCKQNVTVPTEFLDKLYFFQWFCTFPKTLSTLYDTLSYLEICDITSNSFGYQNSFRVQPNG